MCLALLIPMMVLQLAAAVNLDGARALVNQGKVVEALAAIDEALKSAPDDPEVQYQAGELFRRLAADRAARVQQLSPNSAEAHELFGRSLEARGELDQALAEYRAAFQAKAASPNLHYLAGNVLWKKREFESARAELEAELRAYPNHMLANLRLGQVLLSLNQPESALPYLRRAAQAPDSLIETHRALGQAYRALGQHQQAIEQFLFVARRQPRDHSVHAQLAGEYRALGDMEKARAEMQIHRRLLEAWAEAARKR